jgi:hypothetical protein
MLDMGHAHEAPEVSLEPGAEVVSELHVWIAHVGLV